jgi:hypothetical protein
MSGVEAEQDFSGDGVAEIEFVGAGDVAFGADAEEFSFDGVEVEFAVDFLFENFV